MFWKAATRGKLSKLSTWNEIVGFGRVRRELWLVCNPSQTCKTRVRNPQQEIQDPTNLALKCSASSPDTSTFRCDLPATLRFLHFPEHTLLLHASVLSACSSLECPSPTFLRPEKNILILQNLVQLPWFLLICPWTPPARNESLPQQEIRQRRLKISWIAAVTVRHLMGRHLWAPSDYGLRKAELSPTSQVPDPGLGTSVVLGKCSLNEGLYKWKK